MPKSKIHIGISGWRYPPWRGVFYPKKLPQRLELNFASRALSSIEINGSFYALQTPERYAQWYADTPDDFVFSVKAPRYITHVRRLRDIEVPLANFFASGVFNLKEKLGPILWQFPPSFRFEADLMNAFMSALPRDTEAASEIAKQHDITRNVLLEIDRKRPLRHAIEIRNASFETEEFVALLRKHRVALVVADTAGKWPYKEDITSDFIYMRLHGAEELYASGYTDEALKRWHERIRAWSRGSQPEDANDISSAPPPQHASRDVFCYFDNDIKVKAPFDAARLSAMLGVPQTLIADKGSAVQQPLDYVR
ncbi:MAG: hypothetical protein JWN23_1394 [Rhodocyclales bacterium]|nr:hypothetical protein [Rhodocyclales bacterium]